MGALVVPDLPIPTSANVLTVSRFSIKTEHSKILLSELNTL